ncbi:hydroxypyruvate isomerase [Aureimonas jatrophae]|uniref:Hydroxypyruvate isomerase n=1 Tax=Aureimonas jatrophae TaxID=1166073 RepID=A0A1H0FAE6_9HYPH|nr:hydroxypyruvate isomerase [Aureimonas jatrophae]MBB3950106.1 hydroxypyruvate isomerase [Aureimonas jatrophae]SDN91581.1 hydroxypyruvate isomerase [Aureimonas jatrophae]
MPRFAANLSFLYAELPFLDRFEAAARDGFRAVEYVSPYEMPAAEIRDRLQRHGLTQALFNLPAGDWAGGERGIGCLPDRVEEFRQGVDTAIRYARDLHCPTVNCLAGIAPAGADRDRLEDTLVENLGYAAPRLRDAGIALVMEPINLRDIPGFFVSTTDHAELIMDRVGSANLRLQYDVYHTQVMQGDLVATLERLFDRIGHVQVADNPGRHEPGTGEINYAFVLAALDRLGYRGWVGCEYKPATTTTAGLSWMNAWREGVAA